MKSKKPKKLKKGAKVTARKTLFNPVDGFK